MTFEAPLMLQRHSFHVWRLLPVPANNASTPVEMLNVLSIAAGAHNIYYIIAVQIDTPKFIGGHP
jgi:hypothetical protein